jgi:gliding motility-associated-like protein
VNASGGTPGYTYLWNPSSQTTQTATGIAAGTYSVIVTDLNGCTQTASVTVGVTPGGTASISSFTNVTCFGAGNGTATVSIGGGGNPPYIYSWSPSGQTGATAINLGPNTYSVTVTDNNGCITSTSVTITQPPVLTVSTSQTNVSCSGGSNGTATVTPAGGTGPYTYFWSAAGQTTQTITNIAAGTYPVTITDANGCSQSASVPVNQPLAIQLTTSHLDANCNQANGNASVTGSGGTQPYTHLWSPGGQTTAMINSIPGGTYGVTVTDFNGCSQSATVTVANLAGPTASITSSTNVSCFGGNNGSATMTVSGGTAPFSYVWSNGQTISIATNLTAGSYTVTATDASGCTASSSIIITQPTALANNTLVNNPSCFNGSNGTAQVTVTGGTTPYSYSWAPGGQTNSTATGLSAGGYTVTVTDANGCILTQSVTLTNPPQMTASTSVVNVSCNNMCNGSATANPVNGTGPYLYSWNDPSQQSTITASGLCAGSYTVTVTDANGCTATAPATIGTPAVLSASIALSGNVTCFNACNGFAQATASGGTAPYSYMWSPGNQASASVNNLCAGTYTVTATDANGCSATATITITQPLALTASITSTNVTCYNACDGTATVAYTGGVGPYSFLWSPSLGTTPNVTNLCAGTHSVTVTDANGCQVSTSAGITQPSILSASVSTTSPANCGQSNGGACASVIGGVPPFTYVWSDPSAQTTSCASGLVGSSYTVTVTDGNGCLTTAVANVNDIAAPTVTIASFTDVTCAGGDNGTANVTITGGAPAYNVVWSPSNLTTASVTNLNAGVHTIIVTDAAGCVSSANVSINQPSPIVSAITATVNVSCYLGCNGQAAVTATGGTTPYTYLWNDAAAQTTQNATGLCAGSYTVTVTDSLGCSTNSVATITQPTQIQVSTSTVSNVLCNGGSTGSATISVSGGTPGYTYAWTPTVGTGQQITNLAVGSYSVLVTDVNACTQTHTVNITEPAPLALTFSSTPSSCSFSNGSVSVAVTGGTQQYSYQWSTQPPANTATVSNIFAGVYTVTVTDANGCSSQVSDTLFDLLGPAVDSLYFSPVLCNGTPTGTATVEVKNGTLPLTYQWSPGNQNTSTASGLTAGSYTVTVSDANGCSTTGVIVVTQPNPLQVLTSGGGTFCYGQSTQVFASANGGTPGYDIYWDNGWLGVGPHTVTPTGNISYTIFAVDTNGCQSPPVTININVTPPITVTTTDLTICDGDQATITANGNGGNGSPLTYSWSNGPTTQSQTVSPTSGVSPINYIVTVSDGCSTPAKDTVTVIINPVPVAFITANDTSGCAPLEVDFTALSNIGSIYDWDFGDNTPNASGSNLTHIYNSSGLFTVTMTVTTAQGCSTVVTNNNYINVFPMPTASFTANPHQTTNVSPTITVDNTSTGGTTFLWDFNSPFGTDTSNLFNPVFTYADTGVYTVQLVVTNSYGCVDIATDVVTVVPDYILFAPNAFSPNGDGLNDFFFPQGIGIDPDNFLMMIFDRWGNMIYRTEDVNSPWDGHANNGEEVAQIDVYVWIIRTKDYFGEEHEYIGHVSIIK